MTVKSDCREVTKEICTNTPKKTSTKKPVTTCKNIQKVDCKMITKRIPNKKCEPVEHKVKQSTPTCKVPNIAYQILNIKA